LGCISSSGVGNLFEIKEIMDKLSYLRILQESFLSSTRKLVFGNNFIFQYDNDPMHTANIIKEYFHEN